MHQPTGHVPESLWGRVGGAVQAGNLARTHSGWLSTALKCGDRQATTRR